MGGRPSGSRSVILSETKDPIRESDGSPDGILHYVQDDRTLIFLTFFAPAADRKEPRANVNA